MLPHLDTSPFPAPTPAELAHSAELADLIRSDIRVHGAIPFWRFMELALYAPGLGYYSAGKTKFGISGDFITDNFYLNPFIDSNGILNVGPGPIESMPYGWNFFGGGARPQ